MRRLCVWCVVGSLVGGSGGADLALAAEEAGEAPQPQTAAAGSTKPAAPPADMKEALTRKISLDFQDADLKDVLKLLSQQSGVNFIAAGSVQDRKITLFIDQVTVRDVLDQLMRANNLTSESMPESNILIIREAGTGGPQTVTKIFRLRYARLSKSLLAKAVASGGWGAAVGTGTMTGINTGAGAGGGTGIDEVIGKLLTKEGALLTDERTNSLIVTDVPENFLKIEHAIAELDVKTPQILIEAELLEVSASKTKDLGIDWGTEGTLATFTPGQATSRFPFNLLKSQRQLFSTSAINPAPPLTRTQPSYTLGTLDAAQFKIVLQALQNDSDTRVLAHPRVLTLDNEKAVVELISSTAIGKQTSTTATGGTGTATITAERSPTGVRLQVTPQINAEGYITMYVEPVLSRPIASEFFPADFVDPKIRSTSSIVRVRDGETIVIGGLIDRQDTKGLRKVPGLGNVPLVGAAFRKHDDSYSDTELIVFITPHVVNDAPTDQRAANAPLNLPPLAPEQQPPAAAGPPAAAAREQTMTSTIDQMASSPPTTPH